MKKFALIAERKVNNMWFWFSLAVVLLIYAVVVFATKDFDDDFGWFMTGVVACGLAACFILITTVTRTEYIKFEKTFEIQKAQFEAIAESDAIEDSKYVYVIDAINSNKELAEYQASKATWGFVSALPDRVFDIEPIGVE